MSRIKVRSFGLIVLFAILSLFVFGCENETPVDDIYFNLGENQTQLVLLVDQTIDVNDFVVIQPSYASNKNYELSTSDESVIKVEGTKLVALKEGNATIIITSSDNNKKQDAMTVSVKNEKTVLSAPRNLTYNPSTQSFTFDSATNASGYTFKINGVEYNIGNSNSFALSQCKEGALDKLLVVQVKANSPSYSYAFESSAYTVEHKIYQASSVPSVEVAGGELSFEKTDAELYNIYFGDELIFENDNENKISLSSLDEKFAGQSDEFKIVALVDENVKTTLGDGVQCYNSLPKTVLVNVIDSITPTMDASILKWAKVSGVAKYEIFIDEIKVASTSDNYFNLATLSGFENYKAENGPFNIKVEPILNGETKNIAKTSKESLIKFSKLQTPTISFDGDVIKWGNVENAVAYNLTLTYSAGEYPLTNLMANEFSLANYPSDETYSINLQAGSVGMIDGVYYLASSFDDATIYRQSDVAPTIENYSLKFDAVEGDFYLIEFEIDDDNSYSETKEATSETFSLKLDYNFKVGERIISVIHKGDNTNSIDSKKVTKSFVQLGKAENVSVEDETITVEKSNETAEVEILIVGGNLENPISIKESEYAFNTTNSLSPKEDFLLAGNYTAKIYINGDGSATFSCKEYDTINLTVLNAPTVKFPNNSIPQITFSSIDNPTTYAIYGDDAFIENVEGNEFRFELGEGLSKTFKVRALGEKNANIGDMIILSSAFSNELTITRLETPILIFNNRTNAFTVADDKLSYDFKFNDATVPYEFGNKFDDLAVGQNKFSLITKAATGTNYLDSEPYDLTITKIDNACNIMVDENNQLVIEATNQSEEYALEVVLTLNGVEKTFVSNNGELVCDGFKALPYEWVDNKYVISLIDSSYNVRIEDLEKEFGVKARFVKPSTGDDTVANSDYTSNVNLEINKLEILESISVSTDNKLVIATTDLENEYSLRVVLGLTEDLTFVSNGSSLICEDYSLPYTYSNGVYTIDLLQDNYVPIINEMTKNFTVQVQFSMDNAGGETSVDSIMSAEKTITLLPKADLERYAQVLKFSNVMASYTLEYYKLVINDSIIVGLNDLDATINASDIQIELEKISDYAIANGSTESVYKVAVVTLNTETTTENPLLSALSSEIYIEQQAPIQISSYKYNNNEDGNESNSVIVEFVAIETSYKKQYVVEVYNEGKTNVVRKVCYDANAQNGKISFKLDDFTQTGTMYASVYISITLDDSATGTGKYEKDENTIYVFDSKDSNVLEFNKIESPSNLNAGERTITFDAVQNAVGYEIYEKVDGTYNKLHDGLVVTNSYTFSEISGRKEIVVKAISVASSNGGHTNSNYSESIVINKLATPTIEFVNGDFVLTLASDVVSIIGVQGVSLYLEAITSQHNQDNPIVVDLNTKTEGVKLEDNKLTIEAYVLLSYNSSATELTSKNVTLSLHVDYVDTMAEQAVYYLNSDSTTVKVYGLFEPYNVKETSTIVDENVITELLKWTGSVNNVLNDEDVSVGYVFKIRYNDGETEITYYSNDSELKYLDAGELKSYASIISGNQAVFPNGYGINEEGGLNIKFGAGTYKVLVKAVPSVKSGSYNICSSKYSHEYTFTILDKLEPTVSNGKIVWTAQEGATYYKVEVKQGETVISDTTTSAEYDLINSSFDSIEGFCKVTVRAYSDKDNILTGEKSDSILVLRAPKSIIDGTSNENVPIKAEIDDGNVVITATRFFESAETIFVDKITKESVTLPFENPLYKKEAEDTETYANALFESLGITSWADFDKTDLTEIFKPQKFIIKSPSEVLDLVSGRSYTINVRLIGNSNNEIAIVNSALTTSAGDLLVTKLKPNLNEVSYGSFAFNFDEEEYNGLTINYNLNNQETVDALFNDLIIYKINMTVKTLVEDKDGKLVETSTIYSIYAVDYYSVVGKFTELSSSNNLFGYLDYVYIDAEGNSQKLRLNVFAEEKDDGTIQGNCINLRDNNVLGYYPINVVEKDGEFVYSSGAYSEINLSLGGSFAVQIFVLGGDEFVSGDKNIAYLTSNASVMKTFMRYGENEFSTESGKVKLKNLVQMQDGTAIDYPVYRISVTPPNTTNTTIVYLYYNTEEEARIIAERNDPDTFELGIYAKLSIAEDGSVLFDMSEYFNAGVYNLRVKTLAGLGSGDAEDIHYLLNSKETSTDKPYFKISDTKFAINSDGKLEFALGYIMKDAVLSYKFNYEITLIDENGAEIVWEIDLSDANVEYDSANQKFIYTLPSNIETKNGSIKIQEGVNYQIKVRAMSVENNILNGTYLETTDDEPQDYALAFTKSYGATDVKVENGVLKWKALDIDSYTTIKITVVYQDENGKDKVATLETSGTRVDGESGYDYHYHPLNTLFTIEGSGTATLLSAGTPYKLTLYVLGNTAQGIINSNEIYPAIPVERVAEVDTVKSVDGILNWNASEHAIRYQVKLIDESNVAYVFTTDGCSLDFAIQADDNGKLLPAGNYDIEITAVGDDCITSKVTTLEGLTRLAKVTGIEIVNSQIKWKEVEEAQGYIVTFSYTSISGQQIKDVSEPLDPSTLIIDAPTDISGIFIVNIQAVGVGDGKVFNGEVAEFKSSKDTPKPVQEIKYDDEKNRYYWAVTNDFLDGDKLEIYYDVEYSFLNESQELETKTETKHETITYQQYGYYFTKTTESETIHYYYYPLTLIGKYTNFTVQVARDGTVPSNAVKGDDKEFNLFAYGDGGDENPYRISNATHLMNIKYFTDANFELTASIDLANVYEGGVVSENYVIAETFTGTLDGKTYSIYGFNVDITEKTDTITLKNAQSFALFGTINKATIKNLFIGTENIQMILLNSFDDIYENVVKLSMIATGAIDSTIENVNVRDLKIVLQEDAGNDITERISGEVNLSALISEATNTTISNSTINLTAEIKISCTSSTYIGGLVAKSGELKDGGNTNTTKIQNSSAKLSVSNSKGETIGYLGGILGYYSGTENRENGIFNSTAELTLTNIKASNLGGIVGSANYVKIQECSTSGTISYGTLPSTINLGGIVGRAQSSSISASGTTISISVGKVDSVSRQYVGAIAGNLTIVNKIGCEVSDCHYSSSEDLLNETLITTSEFKVGVYGRKDTDVSVTGSKVNKVNAE